MSKCWCGSDKSAEFSAEYRVCLDCQTLIYKEEFTPQDFTVKDDDTDFYGKNYWIKHQQENYGYTDFETRSKLDLTERNLFWLKALLSLVLPPGRVLELGCAHGSFVALLNQTGYEAMGLEMSPWVVEFARETFGIEVLQGPLENHEMPEGTFDAIVLMDVIEHLPDPAETMARCLRLLKPEGVLLIQTPEYKGDMLYEKLLETNGDFLEQLKPREHLFLFSRDSISLFFSRLGAAYMQFLPAIFEKYDMFLAVSRSPLAVRGNTDIQTALQATPSSRIVSALLDLAEVREELLKRLQANEERLQTSEEDRSRRLEQIESLSAQLKVSEEDRLARFDQIQALTQMVKDSEVQREHLSEDLSAIKNDVRQLLNRRFFRRLARSAGYSEVEALTSRLEETRD